MTRTAIYPGTFDTVTRGHEDLITRSLSFVDRVIVGVAARPAKEPLFDLEERTALLDQVLADEPRVEVMRLDGLLAEFARSNDAHIIVRGLRVVSDFDYESQMALMNRRLYPELETVFLVPAVSLTYLSSSLVREVAGLGGDVTGLVHPVVAEALARKFAG